MDWVDFSKTSCQRLRGVPGLKPPRGTCEGQGKLPFSCREYPYYRNRGAGIPDPDPCYDLGHLFLCKNVAKHLKPFCRNNLFCQRVGDDFLLELGPQSVITSKCK